MSNSSYILATNHAGFSNKAHAWVAASELARINNKKVIQNWQGEQQHLTLPNTTFLNDLTEEVHWTKLNTNSLKEPFLLDKEKNYELTCGFNYNRKICKPDSYRQWFKQIQLNHPVINEIIELTKNKNIIGVHIRRTDFFKPTLTDADFQRFTQQIHESWYEYVMADLHKSNKDLIFYIASEDPKIFSYFSERFNVIDRSVFKIEETKRPQYNYMLHLPDLIDLFVLKHVSCFIETPLSSYSHFASLVNDNPSITSNSYKSYFYHKRNY